MHTLTHTHTHTHACKLIASGCAPFSPVSPSLVAVLCCLRAGHGVAPSRPRRLAGPHRLLPSRQRSMLFLHPVLASTPDLLVLRLAGRALDAALTRAIHAKPWNRVSGLRSLLVPPSRGAHVVRKSRQRRVRARRRATRHSSRSMLGQCFPQFRPDLTLTAALELGKLAPCTRRGPRRRAGSTRTRTEPTHIAIEFRF